MIRNSKCRLCDLYRTATNVCVIGSGSDTAELMLIGEAPGEEEDKLGKPFVGKAGKMLDSILINLKINREKIYITNVVKCRPVNNIVPSVGCIESCSPYLFQEIRQVRPSLIVCMGGTAARALKQEHTNIIHARGTIYYTKRPHPPGIPFIITYHPAAIFRQPELLEFIVDDMEWSKRLLTGELPRPKRQTNYQALTSIKDIPGIKEAKWINIDLETDGLDPFTTGKEILSLQISIKEGEGYYFDWNEKIAKELCSYIGGDNGSNRYGNNVCLNGHNIKFDLKWLNVQSGIKFTGRINDTIQNIHLLDENFPHKGLDVVATSFTELKGHKEEFVKLINKYIKEYKEKKEPIRVARERLWKKAFRTIALPVRVEYGCGDADATGRLRKVFRPKLKDAGLIPLHNLMMDTTKMFVDIECSGIKVNTRLVGELGEQYREKINKLKKTLNKISPIDINPNAPLQLRQLLYGRWNCYPHEIRMGKKRVRYSTGKDALELILKDPIGDEIKEYITNLLEYRKIVKLNSVYVEGMPRFLRGGFVHATWNLTGADTGRSACNNPNLQQIPRTGDIKELFISRYSNGVLMQVDVSQGELRLAAHVANEPTLIRLFKNTATDIHTAVAAELLGKAERKVKEEERYNAKQINFAVLYGSGAKTTAQEMKGLSVKDAYRFIHQWHKKFPRWKEHVKEVEEFVIANHYVRNIFGRYRRLLILDHQSPEGMTLLRQAVNAPIQGGLADYNRLCGVNTWRRIEREIQSKHMPLFVAEVHDAWLLDIPKELVQPVAQIIKEEFENVDTSKFGFEFKVPMKVEIKVGNNWKEMEKYEA